MMRASRLPLVFLVLTTFGVAQDQPASKPDAAPAAQPAPAKDAAPDAKAQPAVDAATVNGSTFHSQYFKFTYELPAGWKALDDTVRMKSNREVLEQDAASAKLMGAAPHKSSSKAAKAGKPASNLPAITPVIERYSLMAASPNAMTSLASPVMPRVNIWAHRRVPPFDSPMDNARLAIQGKHSSVLVAPQEVTYNGQTFARVQLITPGGEYESRYIIAIGDYLVGFDFWTQSERELVEVSDTIKSVRFE
jgi:hypothetical protein